MLAEMEKFNSHKSSIKFKALSISKDIKEASPNEENIAFSSSSVWYENFKRRIGLNNIKFTGEAAIGDLKAEGDFSNELSRIIKDGDYLPCLVFNINENCL
ncbi:hypothetical protein AYI69_g1446 [Smittium culicis]|uniref:HTH CENPB-type domain-containing protein n=1 Tax=Smittium culicis TaxID=133412 RepID=A0A1R1YQB8_9FUNG|nr:hypothetical protein AYI69_g1446 [Smittium culicis]